MCVNGCACCGAKGTRDVMFRAKVANSTPTPDPSADRAQRAAGSDGSSRTLPYSQQRVKIDLKWEVLIIIGKKVQRENIVCEAARRDERVSCPLRQSSVTLDTVVQQYPG